MKKDWPNQETLTVENWRYRYFLDANYKNSIKPDHEFFDRVLENSDTRLKHDQTTTVASFNIDKPDLHKTDHNSAANEALVLKRYNPRSYWHTIKRALRGTRARRCWCMSYHFRRAGLNVSKPILMYERRYGLLRGDAYFINRYLQGEELLSTLPKMSDAQQQQVAQAVLEAFSLMQSHRISHGDMKASNLLWVDEQLYFIDLDAAQKHRSQIGWDRAHRKDKARFMKNWRSYPELQALFKQLA